MRFRKSHEPVQQLREMEINNIPLGFGRGKLSPLEPISGITKIGEAGFEPAVSCSQNRRDRPDFAIPRIRDNDTI